MEASTETFRIKPPGRTVCTVATVSAAVGSTQQWQQPAPPSCACLRQSISHYHKRKNKPTYYVKVATKFSVLPRVSLIDLYCCSDRQRAMIKMSRFYTPCPIAIFTVTLSEYLQGLTDPLECQLKTLWKLINHNVNVRTGPNNATRMFGVLYTSPAIRVFSCSGDVSRLCPYQLSEGKVIRLRFWSRGPFYRASKNLLSTVHLANLSSHQLYCHHNLKRTHNSATRIQPSAGIHCRLHSVSRLKQTELYNWLMSQLASLVLWLMQN